MTSKKVALSVANNGEFEPLNFIPDRLVVAGWVGRDKVALQEHIEELGKLGVPAPTRTPIYMNLSPEILSTGDRIDVVSAESSGEVECVLFNNRGRRFIGVGSDHTDRGFEKYDIPGSKQMCLKPVAPIVWDLKDVEPHLDQLILRSWMTVDGDRKLYQEGTLKDNLDVLEIQKQIPGEDGKE